MSLISRLKSNAFPLGLLLLGILLRVEYLREYAASPLFGLALGPDIAEYDARAREILGGRFFSSHPDIHAPLYAWYLAFLYWIGGFSIPLVRGVGLALNLAAGWSCFRLIDRVGGRRVAGWFLFFFAMYPPLIFHSAELVSESLLIPLLALAAWLFYRRLWFFCGLATGLCAITHPMSLFLLMGIAVYFAWQKHWKRAVFFLLAASLVILPVALTRSVGAGRPILIQANSAFNVYLGNNPLADGTCYLRPGAAWDSVHQEAEETAARRGISVDRLYWERVGRFWLDHPLRGVGLLIRKELLLWYPRELAAGADVPGLMEYTSFQLAGGLFLFPLWGLALGGLLWLMLHVRDRRRYVFFLLWGMAFYVGQVLTVVSGRYRAPMLIPVFLLMALSMAKWKTRVNVLLLLIGTLLSFLIVLPQPRGESDGLLGEAYYTLGNFSEAKVRLLASARSTDNVKQFANLLGDIALRENDLDVATSSFQLAYHAVPHDPTAAMNLALTALRRGDLPGAETFFAEMFRRDPDYALGVYNYAFYLQSRGDTEAAEGLYRRHTELAPGDYRGFNALGILAANRGDWNNAEPFFREAFRRAPHHQGLRKNLELARRNQRKN